VSPEALLLAATSAREGLAFLLLVAMPYVMALAGFAQILIVPLVARSKGLGCGLWFLVTALWIGVGFSLAAFVVPYVLASVAMGEVPPRERAMAVAAGVFLLAFAFAPLLAVAATRRRDDIYLVGQRRSPRRGGWRRRVRP